MNRSVCCVGFSSRTGSVRASLSAPLAAFASIAIPAMLLAVCLAMPATAAVRPTLLEGRGVVVRSAFDSPARQALAGETPALSMSAAIKPTEAAKSFALVLSGTDADTRWAIDINGLPFEFDALYHDDAAWYVVPAGTLKSGVNSITLTPPSPATPPLTEAVLFSLENFAEEEHFARLVIGPAILVQPATDPSQDKMDVLHCDLAMTVDMTSTNIPSGILTLTAESLDSTLSTCVLDFNDNGGNMDVDSVDSGPSTSNLTFTHDGTQNRIFITLPAAVPEGNQFTVRVLYHGTPPSGQGWRRSTHDGVSLLYSYSQPYDARDWWPCKDVPHDKFTMDIHVTCPDASYNGYPLFVVSNGTLTSTVDNGATLTYNWSEAYPVSTQYVSITCTNYRPAAGTYTALNGVTTMPVVHYVYPESYASESGEVVRTVEAIDFFADIFGEYPFLTEKYATSSWNYGGGMEHQTCTSMPNGNLATPYHRRNIHELAHMWFGDAIGIRHFDHIWIAEGWGTYCEALWKEHKTGIADYHAQMATWEGSTSDADPIVSTNGDDFNLSITYYKGAWVLHMLRHVIGDTAFFQGARTYMADTSLLYNEGAADSDDVQAHFEAAAGQDLSWFFTQWLYRASRPNYNWTWAATSHAGQTTLHLGIEQTQADSVYEMPIDIRVTYQGGATADFTVWNDARIQNFSVAVGAGTVQSVAFDPDNWILDVATQSAASAPTVAPTLLSVVAGPGTDRMTVAWAPYVDFYGLVGFRLYESANGTTGWSVIQDESVLDANTTTTLVTGLAPGTTRFFRLTPVSTSEGPYSDVYGASIPVGAGTGIMLVDGYDRWNSQSFSGGLNHAIAASHGRAVAAYTARPVAFDTCANEAVGDSVLLGDYDVVLWSCGDESTGDETFSSTEQGFVQSFLESGGKLFVSGNEIGWDLGRATQPQSDQDFYHNYLKANYVADSSSDSTVAGSGGASAFLTDAFSFGSGDAPYLPGFPDVISANGSADALEYSVGNVAGVQYVGTFGSSSTPGAVIYVGFAFETLDSETQRETFMARVLDAFVPSGPPSVVNGWYLM